MNTYFKATISKHAEEDNFAHGCLPHTGIWFGIVHTIKADNLTELVKNLESYCNGKAYLFEHEDNQLVIQVPENEDNRLVIQVLENEDGFKASESQIACWKNGKIKLYLVDYICYITKITEDSAIRNELETLKLETI